MTPTNDYPATMTAAIDPAAIQKVSRFFNATLQQIVNEMLQNARRSGATQVTITTTKNRMRITDDGSGISDPGNVLAFGRSNWMRETIEAEDPAGMGVFSLARRNCTIESRPIGGQVWTADLTPEHFLGEASAQIAVRPKHPGGSHFTSIEFEMHETPNDAQWTVRGCTKHFPLPVTLDGRALEQEPFLKDAMFIQEWNGVRIGVYKSEPYSWDGRRINFHGQTVACDKLPRVSTREGRHHLGSQWHAQVDIDSCPGLELVLPARGELVQNDALDKLMEAARGAIYQVVLEEEVDDLPYDIWKDAKALGLALPPRNAKAGAVVATGGRRRVRRRQRDVPQDDARRAAHPGSPGADPDDGAYGADR